MRMKCILYVVDVIVAITVSYFLSQPKFCLKGVFWGSSGTSIGKCTLAIHYHGPSSSILLGRSCKIHEPLDFQVGYFDLFIIFTPASSLSPPFPQHITSLSTLNPSVSSLSFPLLGREAARCPGVNGGDFGFQCGIDESMACKRCFLGEQGGDDFGFKGLTAAALMRGGNKETKSAFLFIPEKLPDQNIVSPPLLHSSPPRRGAFVLYT